MTFAPNATAPGYCATCGARKALHVAGRCPEAYRPDTLTAALDSLDRAKALGDQAAIFTARGEVQRLARGLQHGHASVTRAACRLCQVDAALR